MFFEGPEKKLEITTLPGAGTFRNWGREAWEQVVSQANAQILSSISNDFCDAYLLSESSLFVWDNRITLITCGRTTLVNAALLVLEKLQPQNVESFFFERKNEHFPQYQPSSFYEDVKTLRKKIEGTAMRFGDEHEHHIFLFAQEKSANPAPDDTTTEILMHGISERARSAFISKSDTDDAKSRRSMVSKILPEFEIDEFYFEPCGYSMNAIWKDEYYTIHVTPEDLGSYVSFESNRRFAPGELDATINRVLEIFEPGAFDFLRFEPGITHNEWKPAYDLRAKVEEELKCGFRVTYANYSQQVERASKAFQLDDLI